MCCFSRPVDSVTGTSIFARATTDSRQFIAYRMSIKAPEDVAMILPIPVAAGSREGSVQFVNLETYPGMFNDFAASFPPAHFGALSAPAPAAERTLKVEHVGKFAASFVPTVPDFARLDPRFRLPEGVWEKLPQYAKYGFVVFALRKGAGPVHPMAFSFPTARPDALFFPTVHIHDGKVHAEAKFDHTLYAQTNRRGLASTLHWAESERPAGFTVNIVRTNGLVAPTLHLRRSTMNGVLRNDDTWLRVA